MLLQRLGMAQYFDFPVRVSPAEEAVDVINAKWCEVEPTAAVSTRTRKLYFTQEEVRPGCPCGCVLEILGVALRLLFPRLCFLLVHIFAKFMLISGK